MRKTRTVSELIAELGRFPDDAVVALSSNGQAPMPEYTEAISPAIKYGVPYIRKSDWSISGIRDPEDADAGKVVFL